MDRCQGVVWTWFTWAMSPRTRAPILNLLVGLALIALWAGLLTAGWHLRVPGSSWSLLPWLLPPSWSLALWVLSFFAGIPGGYLIGRFLRRLIPEIATRRASRQH